MSAIEIQWWEVGIVSFYDACEAGFIATSRMHADHD